MMSSRKDDEVKKHIINNKLINKARGAVQNRSRHCKCASGTGTRSGEVGCNVGYEGKGEGRIEDEEYFFET